jgi:MFS superfamily sulfate permease-like transporter
MRKNSIPNHQMRFMSMLKRPSAFLPVLMSLAALGTVLIFLAMHGVVHEPDEGTAAHIWQLLMALQAPVIAFFAMKWLPRAPRQALYVLVLQALAALATLAPVFLLRL